MYINREKSIKISVVSLVVILCIAIVALILNGINQFKVGSQLATINQVSSLSHLLVRQQTNLLSIMLLKNARNDEISEALDLFSKEDVVIDATLYAANGTLIAQSQNAQPFEPKLLQQNGNHIQQIVEPIFLQQELAGFLRVTFDAQYAQTTRSKVNELFHLLYGELIVLFLAGGLFVSCFYLFRRKTVHHQPHQVPKLATENQRTQSQRFHSRRRSLRRK